MNKERPVLADILKTQTGHSIGVLTLNSPQSMNASDLEMVNLVDQQLARWQKDDEIVAVFMRGAGDKAFCAGGNIRKVYNSMITEGEERYQYGDDFFTGEYGKNYRVHLFQKPLIAWGNGFVMGGGLGLFVGANHRVGTETLKLAWPEIRIGLYPDVAGGWYMSRLPYPYGHWMGLSASHFNALDSKQLEFVQYALPHAQQQAVIEQLAQLPWQTNLAENHRMVRELLKDQENIEAMPASHLDSAADTLKELFKGSSLAEYDAALRGYEGDDAWIKQGIGNYLAGNPVSAHVIMEQIARAAHLSLREVVQMELGMTYQIMRHPDFTEGVRAIVVDKDFQPRWQYADIHAVPAELVQSIFVLPWSKSKHPLKTLPTWKR